MNAKQLTFFDKPHTEMDSVWQYIIEMKDTSSKTRRKVFAEIKALNTKIIELQAENQRLKFHCEDKNAFN